MVCQFELTSLNIGVYRQKDGWLVGWMDRYFDGQLDGWLVSQTVEGMVRLMNGWFLVWADRYIGEQMVICLVGWPKKMDYWFVGQADRQMDKLMCVYVLITCEHCAVYATEAPVICQQSCMC